jgi:putative phosphoesterase
VVVVVISDTHLPKGERRIPEPCLERMRESDLIIHAGDFSTAEVLRELRAIGPPLVGVHGNVDTEEVHRLLPATAVVDAGDAKIGVVHNAGPAHGRLERLRARFPDTDAVVFGHSHVPLHEERDGFQIFNPGSPTDRRRERHHTMGVARVENGRIAFERIDLD